VARQIAFPPGFVWGAATSAYQIEGAAREAGKGESIWDRFVKHPEAIANGDTGEVACDHYHRWADDVALMRELGLAAYRFSIAWTRVAPDSSERIESRGLDFYDRLVDGLLDAGIEPWPTLYHWDLPQRLEDAGGWPAPATATAFVAFADAVTRRLGDRVRHWITINEPWEIGFLGYHQGVNAPGRRDFGAAIAAVHTVLVAHGDAVPVIRSNVPDALVGITLDPSMCYPASSSAADQKAAFRLDGHLNRWFLDPVFGRGYPADMVEWYGPLAPTLSPTDVQRMGPSLDFLGLNYYYSHWVAADSEEPHLGVRIAPPQGATFTDLGWLVHPEGLLESLLHIHQEYGPIPIAITESGAVYDDHLDGDGRVRDPQRIDYHRRYLAATAEAIEAGVPVMGYFAWALLDNFEWASGLAKRFGLIYVDFNTQARTIKASGDWYRNVIAMNGLP
jgi:beta-glucosidase